MASPTTHTQDTIQPGAACEVLPVPPARQLPDGHAHRGAGIQELTQTYGELARQALSFARVSVMRTWLEARHGTVRGYSRAVDNAQTMAARTGAKAREIEHKYPLQVLAGVAGLAFLAGVAGRIWRSRSL